MSGINYDRHAVFVLEALGEHFHVIAWDAPGYGGSGDLPQATPAPADYAEALAGPEQDGPAAASADGAEPQRLGEFKLLRRLGSGGMAEVWLADNSAVPAKTVAETIARASARRTRTSLSVASCRFMPI